MKAFLMYRDRDFDLEQLLSGKEKASRSKAAEEAAKLQRILPWNEQALRCFFSCSPFLCCSSS